MATYLAEQAQGLGAYAFGLLEGLFSPKSRLYLPYLLTALVIAALAYGLSGRSRAGRDKISLGGFFRLAFSPQTLFSASSLVDVKIIIANRLFLPILAGASRMAVTASAILVASFFVDPEKAADAAAAPPFPWLVVMTLLAMLASDFTTYWVHRFHHEHPVLWPFHKVHHSAETMTPVTVYRKHPVYDLTRALSNFFIVGPVQGVIFAAFGVSSVVTILGVNAVYALFHWTGSNLRHSHLWFSYGPFWNRIFISPAQHQIHHSRAPEHHDKNYGEILAVWDWIFGTLYNPSGFEELEFGVADKEGRALPQPHPTLKDAYIEPFTAAACALREAQAERAAEKSQAA